MKWFRFYSEFVDDPKIAMMSDTDQLIWVKALCLASADKQRGSITLSDEEIAWKLRIDLDRWKYALNRFYERGLIERFQGGYRITDWNENQRDRGRLPAHEWRQLRDQIFARDDYTCQYCGVRGVSLQCDHVLPISRGGSNNEENLVTACKSCNQRKHAKTPEEWRGEV